MVLDLIPTRAIRKVPKKMKSSDSSLIVKQDPGVLGSVDLSDYLSAANPADSMLPMVSVVVPCLNEEKHIAACLDSILANTYPQSRTEILIVDGLSTDRTREIVVGYSRRYPFISLIDNPQRVIPCAMNVGIKEARGTVIIKMDAHSICPDDYIDKCVWNAYEYGAQNTGGVLRVQPGADTIQAKAISVALSHPFGSGNAFVKTGVRRPGLWGFIRSLFS